MAVQFQGLGVTPTNLLLPREGIHPTTWAVLACDQHTSEPAWWEETALEVGGAPSTLRLILPECYLGESDTRIPAIHQAMGEYLREGILTQVVTEGMILTERYTASGARVGLVCAVDLEQYDYAPGSKTLVRPTEETIAQRIPPRLRIRAGAPLETSHILLLMDDPLQTVVEPLYDARAELRPLYDFPLMRGGGHLRGWAVEDDARLEQVRQALVKLLSRQTDGAPLLFAVGDGNHSLATAKAHWEAVKATLSPAEAAVHPARYALAEIENIHDDALTFEPIHRFLTGINGYELMQDWTYYCETHGMDLSEVTQQGDAEQALQVIYGGSQVIAAISKPDGCMAVDTLQRYLDDLMARRPGLTLDYIHGEDTLRALCGDAYDRVGFVLPAMDKEQFFPTLRRVGVLPRKTFSMGEANEKRYYMECRKIR